MKNRSLIALLGVALAAIAGAAWASPDMTAAVVSFLTSPDALVLAAWGPAVRSLQAQDSQLVASMRALVTTAEGENRDLTEAEAATFAQHKAGRESLKARIDRAQQLELDEAGLAANSPVAPIAAVPGIDASGRSVVQLATAALRVSENVESDPNRGFRSMGDFARAVVGATMASRTGTVMDSRLAVLMSPGDRSAAAPSTYGNEGLGADGGFLVPPGFSTTVNQIALEEQSLLSLTDQMPIEGNTMTIPKDETTPWGSTGVRAYWQGEAAAGTATKPIIGRTDMRLKKLLALVPVTEELLGDATALNAYLPPNMGRSIRWKSDEAVLFGNGAGAPLGAFIGAAAVSVAKETSQTAATINVTNVTKMISRLLPGSYSRAVWLVNNDALPQLFTMTMSAYPVWMATGANSVQASPYGNLLGRPIIVTQHAKTLGTQGDIMLADLQQYQSITKAGGITMATSMHLYFDADAVAFKATFRVDGQPKLAAAVSPANGSNTMSAFVQLDTRA